MAEVTERVWDRFLTEQDRAHLAHRPHKRRGFGNRPALLLVDLYRWVFGDKPEPLLEAVKTWPASCGLAGWNALPYIQTLLDTARGVGIPIIHVAGGLAESAVAPWTAPPIGPDVTLPTSPEMRDRARLHFQFVDEVTPLPDETVMRKSSPSAFWGTPLVGHLNYLRVDTVIVCGEVTSGCVLASVIDGCTYRYRMVVAEECVFDRHEAAHAISLFSMDQKYADVLPLAKVVEFLRSWRSQRDRQQPTSPEVEVLQGVATESS